MRVIEINSVEEMLNSFRSFYLFITALFYIALNLNGLVIEWTPSSAWAQVKRLK